MTLVKRWFTQAIWRLECASFICFKCFRNVLDFCRLLQFASKISECNLLRNGNPKIRVSIKASPVRCPMRHFLDPSGFSPLKMQIFQNLVVKNKFQKVLGSHKRLSHMASFVGSSFFSIFFSIVYFFEMKECLAKSILILKLTKEMLKVVSRLMVAGNFLIKALTFDAHHQHRYMKEALFGWFEKLNPQWLEEIPWWNELEYQALPPHALPRLPLRLCYHRGESIICLPGVCVSFGMCRGGGDCDMERS